MGQQLKHVFFFVFFIAVCFYFTACVSVKIPNSGAAKSHRANFIAPTAPYKQFFPEHLDVAWRDDSARSISFLSECGGDERVNLQDIVAGLARAVGDGVLSRETPIIISGQTGLRSVIEGKIEGQASTVDLVVFQQGDCTYILNYIAKKSLYGSGLQHFESFLTSFKVDK